MLKNNIGLEPRAFEEIVRNNISLQKLSESFTKDIKLSDDDILNEYKKEFGQIKISYILLEPKDYLEEITIDENAAKDFYEKNKGELIIKSNLKGAIPDRPATFEESKADIERYLKEIEARKVLKIRSAEIHKELMERIVNKGETFANASARLDLKVKDTDLFSKKDPVEALGDAPFIIEASYELKDSEPSKPLEINKGYIIFVVTDKKAANEEEFAKEKEEYSKKLLEARSNLVMERWLKGLEEKAQLAIKLEDADKQYQ